MGKPVDVINNADLLSVSLYVDLKVNFIHSKVQKLYYKVSSVLFNFKDIPLYEIYVY